MTTRELTVQQKKFLEILFDPEIGGDPALAKELAGYGEYYHYSKVLKTLKDEIVEYTKNYLVIHGPKAAKELVGVLKKPDAKGAKNTLAAAIQILDRMGVVKEEPQLVLGEGPVSIIMIPAKKTAIEAEVIDASPETERV